MDEEYVNTSETVSIKLNIDLVERVGLAMVMLIPGLMKLGALGFLGEPFAMNHGMVTGMLTNLGFVMPGLLAWGLIAAEIGTGLALLLNYKVKPIGFVPAGILLVATFTMHFGNPVQMLVHLVLAMSFVLFTLKR